MTNTAAAAKSLRSDEKRRLRNKARKTEIKTLRKKLLRAIHDGDQSGARDTFRRLSKRLDQAAAKGVLHRNAVDRSKSRLTRQLATLVEA